MAKSQNFEVLRKKVCYKPPIMFFLGMILNPLSLLIKKRLKGIWEYYGFESIIILKKI